MNKEKTGVSRKIVFLIHVLSWRQQEHQCLCFHYWNFLTNFWGNNWRSIFDTLNSAFMLHQFLLNFRHHLWTAPKHIKLPSNSLPDLFPRLQDFALSENICIWQHSTYICKSFWEIDAKYSCLNNYIVGINNRHV